MALNHEHTQAIFTPLVLSQLSYCTRDLCGYRWIWLYLVVYLTRAQRVYADIACPRLMNLTAFRNTPIVVGETILSSPFYHVQHVQAIGILLPIAQVVVLAHLLAVPPCCSVPPSLAECRSVYQGYPVDMLMIPHQGYPVNPFSQIFFDFFKLFYFDDYQNGLIKVRDV